MLRLSDYEIHHKQSGYLCSLADFVDKLRTDLVGLLRKWGEPQAAEVLDRHFYESQE